MSSIISTHIYGFRQILLNDWMDWAQISIGSTVLQPLKRFCSNFHYINQYYKVIGCLFVCLFVCNLSPAERLGDLTIFLLWRFQAKELRIRNRVSPEIRTNQFLPFSKIFRIWNDCTNIFEFTSEKSGKPKETKMISSSPIATLATRGYGRSH